MNMEWKANNNNTITPSQTLVQTPTQTHPSPTSDTNHATTTQTQTHPPVHTGLVKPNPNPLIHSPPYLPPRAKHIHISHTPTTLLTSHTTFISSTSFGRHWTQYPNQTHTHRNHTFSGHHTSIAVTLELSQQSHIPHKHQRTHHSHRTLHSGYKDNLTDRTMTWLHTPHWPCSKIEMHLIILRQHKGIKNKLSVYTERGSEDCHLLLQDVQCRPPTRRSWNSAGKGTLRATICTVFD